EYAIDPLEILFVREVMRTNIASLPQGASLEQLVETVRRADEAQRLFPIVSKENKLGGVLTRKDLINLQNRTATLTEAIKEPVVTAFPDEPLRVVVYRMAETGVTRMPVVQNDGSRKVLGMISLADLLRARTRDLEEERKRERVLRFRLPFSTPSRSGVNKDSRPAVLSQGRG